MLRSELSSANPDNDVKNTIDTIVINNFFITTLYDKYIIFLIENI